MYPKSFTAFLKARAAGEGMTLSDFLKKELALIAEPPSMKEWVESTKQLKPIRTDKSSVQIIRELRDAR